MEIDTFNGLGHAEAADVMQRCCTASRWVNRMVEGRPYPGIAEMLEKAREHWSGMVEPDWLEAFEGHPRIGDPESLKAKYRATQATASGEQSSVRQADEETLTALAEGNQAYVERFGFIFIIFASGKSAPEMLAHLRSRLGNNRRTELATAAGEQWKITRRRLEELFAFTRSHAA
ncbi:MAG: 2-oxo-4-hydroxy-4-carboxy-5-ureidoimidazoline decarboxylase [Gammaproteobacteria bacterium]|nr:2-oxo-4-hydroxy-4-carboxy-5-ureidoimidazoline decarboxylase [Gammaproteobacteria bacterium]